MNDPDLAEVVRREQALLDPEVRARADQVGALLHPDFVEVGTSGRIWDRAALIEALRAEPSVTGAAADFAPTRLAADVVLLTFRLLGAEESLRSSVWVHDPQSGWRLRFHQGTSSPVR